MTRAPLPFLEARLLPIATASVYLMCAAAAASAQSSSPALPRVEDFRLDTPRADIEAAQLARTRSLSAEAYLWGMAPFLHFRQSTEIKRSRLLLAPKEEPFGGWVLLRKLATPDDKNNVMPNVDTLYGAAYVLLDKQGPVVLSIPAVEDRYYSVAILDAYFNNFEIVGTRHTQGRAADILILPPGFQGKASGSFSRVVRAPTNGIALFQRIYTRDLSDVPAVHKIQDQIRLTTLERWRKKQTGFPRIDTPEFDVTEPVRETRDPLIFFRHVSEHTCRNKPAQGYAALVTAFAQAGLGPCIGLPSSPDARQAIVDGAKNGQAILNARISSAPLRNGWRVPDPATGLADPDYLARADVQITQIASFSPDEAMYFVARQDGSGNPLDGRSTYVLKFPAGQLPPVGERGFWSLTMYRASDNLLVNNPIDRYILRPTTPGLTQGGDGSLSLYLGHERPGGAPGGNWLPAPPEGFVVVLRTYLPDKSIQGGSWFPPAIAKQQ